MPASQFLLDDQFCHYPAGSSSKPVDHGISRPDRPDAGTMVAMHDDAPAGPNWQHRITVAVVAVIAAVLGYLIAAAVIPRWWAQRVARVVDGSLTTGALYGLFIGFVFTVAPLLLFLAVWKWQTPRRTWLGWIGWFALVLLLAAPNLMTLSIVLGISNAAHDGDRTLSVQGPGFRLWSLIGAIAGAVAVLGTIYLLRSRRSSRQRAADLRDQMRTGGQT
jgi:hypothetical protein